MMHPTIAGQGLLTPNMADMEAGLLLARKEYLLLED